MELSDKFIDDLNKLGYSSNGAYILGAHTKEYPYEDADLGNKESDDDLIGCLIIDWADFKYLFTDNAHLNVFALKGKENSENIPFLKVIRQEGAKFYNIKVFKTETYIKAEKAELLIQGIDNQFLMVLPLKKTTAKEFAL